MPEENAWNAFFDPAFTLRSLSLTEYCRDVVEFGCGYGTFTIPAAQIVSGTVYALDIDRAMVRCTAEKAAACGLKNVVAKECDFLEVELSVPPATADYVMLFNILHAEQPEMLLDRVKSVLRPRGLLGVMHWNYDPTTPRGPSMNIRPRPEQCQQWAESSGFFPVSGFISLPPYHYGFVMQIR
jgi:SAM-dependent methyltransferase